MNESRIIPSNSNDRLLSSQNENSIPSSLFIFEENPSELRSTESFIIQSHSPICVSESYHADFLEYVSVLNYIYIQKKNFVNSDIISFIRIIMVNLIMKVHL